MKELVTFPGIQIKNLTIGYSALNRKNIVFGPADAEIHRSEMVGIIGRNGIGKSTLLRTIAGMQVPVEGEIFLQGKALSHISLKEMARIISYVSTETVRNFQIKVHELVAMGRLPYTGWLGILNDADRNAIDKAIYLTNIGPLLEKFLHEVSDGERQKVMIARALAQDTPLIVLDEPTAFLDLPSRYEILKILHDLSTHNEKTIVFTTHDLSIALDISDKLMLMDNDKIYQGAPEDLLINSVFRKLFLNSPADFNPLTGSFGFRKKRLGTALIKGNREYGTLTKKAMERMGFQIVEDRGDIMVKIDKTGDITRWNLEINGDLIGCDSIYELCKHIRNSLKTV